MSAIHTSTITSKGQITIPAEMRKALELVPGKRVAFRMGHGQITLEAVKDDITAAFGILKSGKTVSLEQMEQTIAESATSRFHNGMNNDK